ncbi:MAG: DUF5688 family protein [Lachnospiraceae bacterium]|nr:DUF5688 family protein [Lachnospiraceae bacterium]
MSNIIALDYEQFKDELIKGLTSFYDGQRKVLLEKIQRNNDIILDGIIIQKLTTTACPTFYVNQFFTEYLKGSTLSDIIKKIACTVSQEESVNGNISFLNDFTFNWEYVKNNITFRLINATQNEEYLNTVPHRPFCDLAVIYHCYVEVPNGLVGTIRISNEHLKNFEVLEEDLFEAAKNNASKKLSPVCKPIAEVLKGIISKCPDANEEDLSNLLHYNEQMCPSMYVLSNEDNHYGATSIIFYDYMKTLHEKIGRNYFVLPSSIHEVIIVPDNGNFNGNELKHLVHQVNTNEVPIEEILSDEVYYVKDDGIVRLYGEDTSYFSTAFCKLL